MYTPSIKNSQYTKDGENGELREAFKCDNQIQHTRVRNKIGCSNADLFQGVLSVQHTVKLERRNVTCESESPA